MIARASIKNGDEIDVLTTKSGRVYEEVVVREILPDGLRIGHSSGAAKIPSGELPQYADVFAKIQPADEPEEMIQPESLELQKEQWVPSSQDEVVDCSLFVKVSKGLGSDGKIGPWSGSAFLCNHGQTTYIYSNLHNFDGAIEFTIEDRDGNEVDDFASVEVASNGQAFWKEMGWGGDIVRIRLNKFREKALTLDPQALSLENSNGRKILVTGNTKGAGVITRLEGQVTELVDGCIIKHNAATQSGNSGSPIIDMKTYKVIGILTWGTELSDPLQAIWSKMPVESREGINVGTTLAGVRFSKSSFTVIQKQREVMNQLKSNVRLLGLLDTLIPTKEGLFVNSSMTVMGDYTVDDLLRQSPNHPVVLELVALDKYLTSRANSNIGTSNQDILRRYVATYRKCLDYISGMRRGIENSTSLTFYMKCNLKRSRIIDIARAYENLSNNCLSWYARQAGTGGEALPLGGRIRLPQLQSGLAGLGLKDE